MNLIHKLILFYYIENTACNIRSDMMKYKASIKLLKWSNDMEKNKKGRLDYTPSYTTFPLANTEETIKDSNVSIPSYDDVVEAKDWVDFKET